MLYLKKTICLWFIFNSKVNGSQISIVDITAIQEQKHFTVEVIDKLA